MFTRLLRRLAWRIIEKTSGDIPWIVFTHKECGSKELIPLARWFNWEAPTFECLGCGVLTDDVECELVEKPDFEHPTSWPPPLARPLY